MIKFKLMALALALVLSAVLMARAASTTGAYFSDTKAGVITGTLGNWAPSCTLEPGTSKARHWDDTDPDTPHVQPIAQLHAEGQLYLDFGDETAGNSNSSPDVFRVVSHDTLDRAISFAVEGDMSLMIATVELDKHGDILAAGAARSVRVKLGIPKSAVPGEYSGELVISVEGSGELLVPMVVTVRRQKGEPRPHFTAMPVDGTPTPRQSGTPSPPPSPAADTGSWVVVSPSSEPPAP